MRRFTIFRRGDLSGSHDANQVNPPDQPQCEGAVFSDGSVVLRWLTAAKSTSVWADFDTMMKVHGHTDPNSKHGTDLVWHDPEGDKGLRWHSHDQLVELAVLAYAQGGSDAFAHKAQQSVLDHVVTVGDLIFFAVGWIATKTLLATWRASR